MARNFRKLSCIKHHGISEQMEQISLCINKIIRKDIRYNRQTPCIKLEPTLILLLLFSYFLQILLCEIQHGTNRWLHMLPHC